jgi:hypothetical protein
MSDWWFNIYRLIRVFSELQSTAHLPLFNPHNESLMPDPRFAKLPASSFIFFQNEWLPTISRRSENETKGPAGHKI